MSRKITYKQELALTAWVIFMVKLRGVMSRWVGTTDRPSVDLTSSQASIEFRVEYSRSDTDPRERSLPAGQNR